MSFSIHFATLADTPGMAEVWYAAFNTPVALKYFPPTPASKAWFSSSFSKTIKLSTPAQTCVTLVMKDDSIEDPVKSIVAFARFFIFGEEWSEDWRERYEARMPEEMSEEVMGEGLCDPMARQHRVHMGKRKHYFLEVLATHEKYRGLGLASKLLKRGLEMADESGLESYLDASKMSQGLYEKNGFVVQVYRDEKCKSAPMIRPVGGKREDEGS